MQCSQKAQIPLIQSIIPERKKLLQELIRLTTDRVVVHSVRDELLDALDLRRRVGSVGEVHIHVFDVGRGVDGDGVLCQLSLVVEGGPVARGGEDVGCFFDFVQFVVGVEHVFEDLDFIGIVC